MDQKTEDLKCADQEAIDQKYMREAIKQAKKSQHRLCHQFLGHLTNWRMVLLKIHTH